MGEEGEGVGEKGKPVGENGEGVGEKGEELVLHFLRDQELIIYYTLMMCVVNNIT